MDELRDVSLVSRGGCGIEWRFWCNSANGLTLNYRREKGLTLNYLERMV
jgi:hypothetical protein